MVQKLALIGFVFTKCPIGFIFVIRCIKEAYIHLTFSEIGFVLHKKVIILCQAGLDRRFVRRPVDSCSLGRLENIWVSLAIGKAPGLTIDD